MNSFLRGGLSNDLLTEGNGLLTETNKAVSLLKSGVNLPTEASFEKECLTFMGCVDARKRISTPLTMSWQNMQSLTDVSR